MAEECLNKTFFVRQSAESADNQTAYWLRKSYEERLIAAYHLSLRAYGYDPQDSPKMEKSLFSSRKRK